MSVGKLFIRDIGKRKCNRYTVGRIATKLLGIITNHWVKQEVNES